MFHVIMPADRMTKRELLRYAGAGLGVAGISSLAGCSGGGDGSSDNGDGGGDGGGDDSSNASEEDNTQSTPQGPLNDDPLTYIIPEGQLDIPIFLATTQEGIWRDRRLKINPKVTSFGKYARGLTTGDSRIGSVNASIFNSAQNQDQDVLIFGANLQQLNSVFVRSDSDIESPADLESRKVGVPFWSSGTTKTVASMIYDEFDIHLEDDTRAKSAPPAVLWEQLVSKEELDAIVEFTGFTIKGLGNPDKVREIMSARKFWKDRTGYPSLVTMFAARGDYIRENPDVARNFLEGWNASVEYTKNNLQEVFDQFGLLAGLESDAEFEVALDQFESGNVTVGDPAEWNQDLIDAQFQLFEAMNEAGFTEGVPTKNDSRITYSELQDL